jgi:ammonia channel protein AmtB
VLDIFFGIDRKPTFLGAVNGMIDGLVAITPAAGYIADGARQMVASEEAGATPALQAQQTSPCPAPNN